METANKLIGQIKETENVFTELFGSLNKILDSKNTQETEN